MAKINSRQKGKRVERAAAKYLTSLGFAARRGVQHAGGPESPDVVCECLKRIHFEVKGDRSIGLGTKALLDAVKQSENDSKEDQFPVVLWREHRKGWRLSYMDPASVVYTVAGDSDILTILESYREEAA